MSDEFVYLKDLIFAKVGVLQYKRGSDLQYVSEDELFNENSLLTYIGKPVTINHPQNPIITETDIKNFSIGTVINVYRDNYLLKGEIRITKKGKKDILNHFKDRFELSLGYSTKIIDITGEFNNANYNRVQTDRRINHLALVKRSRVGEITSYNLDSLK